MQLSIFNQEKKEADQPVNHWHIFVDGASRNNPGKAAAGIYIKKNGEDYLKKGFYLNIKTNNEAEYLALLLALLLMQDTLELHDNITITSDSQLLINQLNGSYAVKKAELKKIHIIIQQILEKHHCILQHVLREHNVMADKLANHALDKKTELPPELIQKLNAHEITI